MDKRDISWAALQVSAFSFFESVALSLLLCRVSCILLVPSAHSAVSTETDRLKGAVGGLLPVAIGASFSLPQLSCSFLCRIGAVVLFCREKRSAAEVGIDVQQVVIMPMQASSVKIDREVPLENGRKDFREA